MKRDFKEITNLVDAIKLGDNEKFDELYSLTYKRIYFFALTIIKDEALAHDIVQDVYLDVYKNIKKLNESKAFTAWVNKITYNRALKYIDKKNDTAEMTDEISNKYLIDRANPLMINIKGERNKELIEAVLSLNEKHRNVIILKYFYDYKMSTIANILGCPEGTVKSRLNTAKKQLKGELIKNNKKVSMLSIFMFFYLSSALSEAANAATLQNGITDNINAISIEGILQCTSIFTEFLPVKSIIVVAATVGVVGTGAVHTIDKSVDIVKVEAVNFSSEPVKTSIEIEVVFNNEDIDNVIIIDSERKELVVNRELNTVRFKACKNDMYEVLLNDKDEIRYLQGIKVDNIDSNEPIIVSYDILEDKIVVKIEDDKSGINFNSIILEDQLGNKKEIEIDELINEVRFKLEVGNYIFKFKDNVGNESVNTIRIKEQ